MSEVIRLKNGADLPVELAASLMFNVRHVWRRFPIAAIELIALCRDPAHRPFGNTAATLQAYTLLQPDGTVHTAVRDLVLSAVQGDGEHMTLGSPYAGGGDAAMIHPLCEKDWPPPGTPLTLAQYHAATGWHDGILCQADGPGARIFYGLHPEPGYRTDTPADLTQYSGAALLAQYAAGGYNVFRVTHLAAGKYWCVHHWSLAVESAVTP